MSKKAVIGQPAPLIQVSDWVQGTPTNLDQLTGRVVLLEVFQVNCPGCFLYAVPEAVELHQKHVSQGLTVIGIATAFEDFDKNTLENLRLLAQTGQVNGETLNRLKEQNMLDDHGRLPYSIPFPLAMDRLIKTGESVTPQGINDFVQEHIPNFNDFPVELQEQTLLQIHTYLEKLEYRAETFHRYSLKGTPSQILIDKNGVLRHIHFGVLPNLENRVLDLLNE